MTAMNALQPGSPAFAPAHGAMVSVIVEQLRNDILAQRIRPGSRLVENDLTRRFNVSRGPVREGLRRLAAEGLIDHNPNRGAVVKRLTRPEMTELFQIRIELEQLAARLAAQSSSAEKRAAFETAIQPIYRDGPREAASYFPENSAFHGAVMELAGNRQLTELNTRLQFALIMGQVGDVLAPEVLETSVREHRAIAAAILEHDAERASAATRAHLDRAATLAASRLPA